MAYWALEALDGSKTALSSLDRVEGTDPPAYKLGRRPHEESHFGTLPICVSRNQAQLTPCHDGVAIRHSGSAPTGVLRHHGAFDSNEDVGQWVWLTQEMGSTVIRHGDTNRTHASLLDFLADAAASVSAFLASRTLIKKISDAALLSGKSMLATVSHLALLFDAS